MADAPKTWDLLGAMVTCLQAITQANGYLTDAGGYVTREPAQIPDDQPALIAIALESLQRSPDPALSGERGRLATVVVVGKVPITQADAQIRLHEIVADIERCFSGQQSAFAVGTSWPKFVDAKMLPPAEGMSWIGAEVRFASLVRLR